MGGAVGAEMEQEQERVQQKRRGVFFSDARQNSSSVVM